MPKKDLKVRLRNRKNYLPTVMVALVLWSLISFIILKVDPILIKDLVIKDTYFFLISLIFLASFLSLSLVLASTKRGFLVSLGLIIFLYLRLKGLGNFVNAILIGALLISLDLYSRPSSK